MDHELVLSSSYQVTTQVNSPIKKDHAHSNVLTGEANKDPTKELIEAISLIQMQLKSLRLLRTDSRSRDI
jgi:hypothetical protein